MKTLRFVLIMYYPNTMSIVVIKRKYNLLMGNIKCEFIVSLLDQTRPGSPYHHACNVEQVRDQGWDQQTNQNTGHPGHGIMCHIQTFTPASEYLSAFKV